jgi:DNA-binding transcriptional LysR family regulator
VLAEAQKLQGTLQELAGEQRITLRLAASTVSNSTLLPAILGPFLADYPEVDLQLMERGAGRKLGHPGVALVLSRLGAPEFTRAATGELFIRPTACCGSGLNGSVVAI